MSLLDWDSNIIMLVGAAFAMFLIILSLLIKKIILYKYEVKIQFSSNIDPYLDGLDQEFEQWNHFIDHNEGKKI